MASYSELKDIFDRAVGRGDARTVALLDRVEVAVILAAHGIAGEPVTTKNHAERVAWASSVVGNTRAEATKALKMALAANAGNTVAQIEGAGDAQLQAAVDAAVDLLAGGIA